MHGAALPGSCRGVQSIPILSRSILSEYQFRECGLPSVSARTGSTTSAARGRNSRISNAKPPSRRERAFTFSKAGYAIHMAPRIAATRAATPIT